MRNPNNPNKIIVKRGLPSILEGSEGDISLNITKYGIGLYGKVNSKWYRFGMAQDFNEQNPNNAFLKQNLSIKDLDVYDITSTSIFNSGLLTVYRDITNTTTSTEKGLYIDYNTVGIVASGQTRTSIGLDIDMNSESVTHVGAINQYGIDLDVVGSTDGTQYVTGIDINVSGSSGNRGLNIHTDGTHIRLISNPSDYAEIKVADTGDLTILTAGDGTTDSDLILDIDGDIELNADGGDITFKDASASLASLSSSGLTINNISEVGSDTDKILMSDSGVVKYVTGANLRSYIGAGTSSVAALNDLSDVSYSSGDLTITSLDTIVAGGDLTLDVDGDIELNADGGNISLKDDGISFCTISSTVFYIRPSLFMVERADAETDAAGQGQLWVHDDTPNTLWFTNDAGTDINISNAVINASTATAVWGGQLPRATGLDGIWLGIPSIQGLTCAQFGTTNSDPDTTYSVSTTADDLCGVIWQSTHSIEVTGVKFFYGQGGATNTTHSTCLMRYDIDSDGDLSNGVKVCNVTTTLNSDDYSQLRSSTNVLTSDVSVSSSQVLIAMIYCNTAINAYLAAKCILEYKEFT